MDLTTQYGVDENNMIIEGNGRYEALKQLGIKKIPCIELKNMTEEQKLAISERLRAAREATTKKD